MPNEEELHARIDPGTIRLAGEVDVSNWDELASVLDRATPKEGKVVIDLSGVAFIDVNGTRQILRFAHRLTPARVTVKGAPASFHAILEAVGWEEGVHLAASDE